jgi:hypothetical protein
MWKLFYFADVVDRLSCTAGWLVFLTGAVFIVSFICRIFYRFNFDLESEKNEKGVEQNIDLLEYQSLVKMNRWGLGLLLLFIFLRIVTPSKNTIYLMAGGKLVDMTIENNPQIKEVPGKTIDLLNAWLEKETGEIKGQENNQQEEVGK